MTVVLLVIAREGASRGIVAEEEYVKRTDSLGMLNHERLPGRSMRQEHVTNTAEQTHSDA